AYHLSGSGPDTGECDDCPRVPGPDGPQRGSQAGLVPGHGSVEREHGDLEWLRHAGPAYDAGARVYVLPDGPRQDVPQPDVDRPAVDERGFEPRHPPGLDPLGRRRLRLERIDDEAHSHGSVRSPPAPSAPAASS